MRLPCPFCGERDQAEFTYEGDAGARRPPLDAPAEAWVEAVYLRDQPRGWAEELWRHAHGCGCFLVIRRNNVTHELAGARLAHPGMAETLETARPAPATEAETRAEASARRAPAARARASDAAGGGGA